MVMKRMKQKQVRLYPELCQLCFCRSHLCCFKFCTEHCISNFVPRLAHVYILRVPHCQSQTPSDYVELQTRGFRYIHMRTTMISRRCGALHRQFWLSALMFDLANQHHRLSYHDAFHIWIFGRSYRSVNCSSNTGDDFVGVWATKCVLLPVISVSILFVHSASRNHSKTSFQCFSSCTYLVQVTLLHRQKL